MTSKAKAKELFKKYSKGKDEHGWSLCEFDSCAKKCALIAVNEIFKTNTLQDRNCGFVTLCEKHKEYWEEVKQEIEKI